MYKDEIKIKLPKVMGELDKLHKLLVYRSQNSTPLEHQTSFISLLLAVEFIGLYISD